MSKKILPFPLVMKNGAKVRSIEELRANADIESIVSFYLDGKLDRWCKAFHYDDVPEYLENATEQMIRQLYGALDIKVNQSEMDSYLCENAILHSETKDESVENNNDAETEVVDNSEVKAKLAEFNRKYDINFDWTDWIYVFNNKIDLGNYAVEVKQVENETGNVNKYKVEIYNKLSKIYCKFFITYKHLS